MEIRVIAGLTCREAARRKVLLAAVGFGLAFLFVYGFALYVLKVDTSYRGLPRNLVLRRQILNGLLSMGLYAVNWLVVLVSVLAAVDTVSGEIASGTIQSIAAKPIRRWRIVAGKWIGFASMLTGYTVLMSAGVMLDTWLVTGHQGSNMPRVMALMWLESLLLLSVTMCAGASLSTRAAGVVALGLHMIAFLGGWIEEFGQMVQNQTAVSLGVAASLAMPSEALWRRAAFEIQGPVVGGFGRTPFSVSSVPSGWMVVYAGVYLAAALGVAFRRFSKRDL